MKTGTRRTAIALSALSAVALAAPAFAAPSTSPTSLNLRAGKSVVKAHHTDTFTATLTSKGKALAGQTLSLQERTAPTTGHQTTWTDVASPTCNPPGCVTDANGHTTSYQYDGLNRMTREIDPAGMSIQTIYDGEGNRTKLCAGADDGCATY